MIERDVPRISPYWLIPPGMVFVLNAIAVNTISSATPRNGVYQWSVVGTALFTAVLFGGYALLVAWLSRRPVRETMAMRRSRPGSRPWLRAAVAVVIISAASLALDPFLHGDRDQGLTPTRSPHGHEWVTLAAALVVLSLIVPLGEELMFRGLGFAAFGRYAVPGTAIAFTVAHGLLSLIVPVLVAGLALALLRSTTGSLWPGYATHASINLIGIVLALLTT